MQALRASISLSLLLVLAGGLAACSSDDSNDGGARTDSGGNVNPDATANADATAGDTGARDATTDAGFADTGGGDAGVADTGAADSGVMFAVTHHADLTGAEENPPVREAFTGSADFNLTGMRLTYRIRNNVMSPTAAHIHRAPPGVNGPVAFPLNPVGADMAGEVTLSAQDLTDLNAGRFYVNIHTAANPGGVIRGQILRPGERAWVAQLTGREEVPPNDFATRGTFSMVVNSARTSMHYELTTTGTPSAAHIHRAPAGVNGPVVYPLMAGRSTSGDQQLTVQDLADLEAGILYANVHTMRAMGGEIRGQIVRPGDRLYVAHLTPQQETPPTNATTNGRGMVIVDFTRTRVRWYLTTTATPTMAHIHLAPAGTAGSVLIPLGAPGRVMAGTATVADTDGIGRGLWYFNVHTQMFPMGEIRGQILRPAEELYVARLSGAEEVPAVNTNATGSVMLVLSPDFSQIHYEGVLMGLTATMAHIHVAPAGMEGGVVYPLTINGDRLRGDLNIVLANLIPLRGMGWYVNVHTAANPNGEIRGQVQRLE